jgi:hypothetical protein
MAKRSGYSTLDYILGGLAGGLRGYGEDKERRKLEAERAEERAALQEERRASRERQEMLDRVMLSDRGYEPARELSEVTDRNVDMPHRLLRPTAEQRYDMPDFATDVSPLQRALETASSGRPTETVGGQRMVRTMTPMEEAEQERSSAALSGRMEAQGRAQTHRGQYDTLAATYPGFPLPPYNPTLNISTLENSARRYEEEQYKIAGEGRAAARSTRGGADGLSADSLGLPLSAFNNMMDAIERGKEQPDRTGLSTIRVPYSEAEKRRIVNQYVELYSQTRDLESFDRGAEQFDSPRRRSEELALSNLSDQEQPIQRPATSEPSLAQILLERFEAEESEAEMPALPDTSAPVVATPQGLGGAPSSPNTLEMRQTVDELKARMEAETLPARRRELFREIRELESQIRASDMSSLRDQFGNYRSRGGGR